MQTLLLYGGSAVIALWGIGHVLPTRSIVAGFGNLSPDHARIITMEWVAEGLTLIFLGVLVAVTAATLGPGQPATLLVARIAAAMLVVLAALSAMTGARTSVLPMKLCPIVKTLVAAALVAATLL